ncbi:tannase/feruloyl esterase family alpha/beta hydrolase [Altericroceibacterium endophyticum]|uniref:Tannase/feruloyl esterase family alpha/beta hydrolase n=1 Tax=Altericroceibacterium endophyticum TaxID=1808508 RepID=A0A6I4T4X1_9SPHN|nr:tannase/feruloyl esterase family alpha/beta hydrolase [Altericroceibacterium endophyticum]MXO66284.1 tannase/feruloyl esterase family alpha/beta hydrolase [Altericroceibacterium endophyticum]
MKSKICLTIGTAAIAFASTASTAQSGANLQEDSRQAPNACSALAAMTNLRGDLEITATQRVAAAAAGELTLDPFSGATNGMAMPAYCKVEGILNRRIGPDGTEYGIRFAVALPDNWNGRYLFQGGGGLNGVVRPPLGTQAAGDAPALARGFAVASTDSGHQGEVFDFAFTGNQQAMLDFAYNAVGRVTQTAKSIIAAHYGRRPDHSYLVGCSTGGREAMVAAQRFPFEFDGVVSGAPAMRTGRSNMALANAQAAFNRAAEETGLGADHAAQLFSPAQRLSLQTAVLEQCDAADGLQDGMIFAMTKCDFDPAKLQCGGDTNSESCLAPAQVQALKTAFAGPKTSAGVPIYSAFPMDPALFGEKVGGLPGFLPSDAPSPLGAASTDSSFDTDAAYLAAMSDQGARLMDSYDFTMLNSFTARGGKMLMYHGTADPWFSALDTVDWYQRMAEGAGGLEQAQAFSRLFLVPGMGHCRGGAMTPDQFDLLSPLVKWVEGDDTPDSVPATARALDNAERKLCPYPAVSTYDGHGDPDMAVSYHCKI